MAGDSFARPYLLFILAGLAASFTVTSRAQPTTPAEVRVGLIIDAASPVGKVANTTIPMALDDFYAAFPNSSFRVRILQHDSGGDVVAAASAALQLMTTQGARAILGPQSSVEAAFVADLATRAEVPVVSFSATSPSVSPASPSFFVRAAVSDAAQAGAVAALAAHFGWRRVVPIYQDDDYGAAFVPFLVDALTAARAEVPYRCALPEDATPDAIAAELYRMESEQTRVFVLHTRAEVARSVFAAAAEAGMTGAGYAWIITDGLTGLIGFVDPPQGVIGLAPYVPTTPRLRDVKKRWAHRYMSDHREADHAQAVMGCYALWAYDAAWAVASAAERLSPSDLSSPPGLAGGKGGPTDISGLGKSRSGDKLLRAISDATFEGLGGGFELIGGELAVPAFRVVSIVHDGTGRGIGFWTPKYGLSRHVDCGSSKADGELSPFIWPGESTVRPRGWVQPTSAAKLRVAVPGMIPPGYRAILYLDVDPETNRTTAGGFVIEAFEAAVRLLPYALPFEYVKADRMPYDQLAEAVNNGKFDAVVADMTITAKRSNHVDFTMPFVATSITMIVQLRDQRGSNKWTWVFLKPLSSGLWIVSAFFFLFTGFVVWAIERRDNERFGGTPSNQAGIMFYFGFSTLVFTHNERLKSNLSRMVVVVWVFVVLILQSSYTASLTSLLTVPRIGPAIADYRTLLEGTAEKVGVLNNSFLARQAIDQFGLPEARVARLQDVQSFQEALLNGSIGAIITETPYLSIFLEAYRENFTATGQPNMTSGFAFAFPKGSPYVTDLSHAMLNLTESDEMNRIERKWLGDYRSQGQGGGPFTANPLRFSSFGSLFVITGATSLVCLTIHLAFFRRKEDYWLPLPEIMSRPSSMVRLRMLAKLFDRKVYSETMPDRNQNDVGAVAFPHPSDGVSIVGRLSSAPPTNNGSVEMATQTTSAIEPVGGG
ncbi:glutamate receptor 2.8-like [Hordeum vulgare subsp. vulgare]|uniref:Glutamate receptor n=1 Tax=Hordeum vulgare subsp. vulgare TaxID=112509 RepID=A0A8I6XFP4_HORVV|nr:glutamate receptor 2.8-like [Hordeum vulgare subsp. vulgare]